MLSTLNQHRNNFQALRTFVLKCMVSRRPYTQSPEAEQPGLPAHLTAAQTAAEPRGASGPAGIGAPQREEQHQRPRKRLEKVGNPKSRPRTSIHLSLALPLPKINTVRLVSLYHCLRMGTRRPSLSVCNYTATSREGSRASGGLPGWGSKEPRGRDSWCGRVAVPRRGSPPCR